MPHCLMNQRGLHLIAAQSSGTRLHDRIRAGEFSSPKPSCIAAAAPRRAAGPYAVVGSLAPFSSSSQFFEATEPRDPTRIGAPAPT